MMYKHSFVLLSFLCLSSLFVFGESSKFSAGDDSPLQSMEGEKYEISGILTEGKNIVFIFWQTWCAPCLRETPRLVEQYSKTSEKFQFFGVISGSNEDVDERKVAKIVKKFNIPYPQVRDRDLSLAHEFEVKETPTIIIMGENNRVLYKHNHLPSDWTAYSR